MSNTLLVPLDGSKYSLAALDVAIDLAMPLRSKIVLCYVLDLTKAAAMTFGESQLVAGCLEALRAEGRDVLERASAYVRTRGVDVEAKLAEGIVADEIDGAAAEFDASMIVMGSHGRSGLARLLVGSVAEGILRRSQRPVVVVPRAAVSERHEAAAAVPASL
jgi:nucleotide-binding universal stress UspA family protein